jgi:lipoprotein-anchoring transpeptidase ErfK/SrfK
VANRDRSGFRVLIEEAPRLRGTQPLPADTGTGRRIVYSNSGQQVWLVGDDNAVIRTFRVSGKKGVPNPGWYKIQSKSPVTNARGGGIWMRHMTRFSGGIGFHEIPIRVTTPMQTVDELGQYRSHGCVRLAPEDADFVYNWATVGVPVLVLA